MYSRSPFRPRHRSQPAQGFLSGLIDPIDRLSETIFSILILLTYTLAYRLLRLPEDSSADMTAGGVNELLLGALGAILAWGAIDGVMYALFSMFERGEKHRLLVRIQSAEDEAEAVAAIADELDYVLDPITAQEQRRLLYAGILTHLKDSRPQKVGFRREDLTGALGHVVVALMAVIPSLLPLVIFRSDTLFAIQVSNIVSFIVLFIVGYQWGKYTYANPWKTGLLLTAVAVVMMLVAIPLGG